MSRLENERAIQTKTAPGADQDVDHEQEHDADSSRRASNAGLRAVQRKAAGSVASQENVQAAAEQGVASPTTAMPHADKIQESFGAAHDVSKIRAHVGGSSADAMGATAYASGDHAVFDKSPDLHTAAHEAAHIVQQANGVNLYGGVGKDGDGYERQADAVADRVVAGQSAADLLGAPTKNAAPASTAVQRKPKEESLDATTPAAQKEQRGKSDISTFNGIRTSMTLFAVRLKENAAMTDHIIGSETLGGPTLKVQQLKSKFEQTSGYARDLENEVAKTDPAEYQNQLWTELAYVYAEFDTYQAAANRALKFATDNNETLSANPYWIQQEIDNVRDKLGAKDASVAPKHMADMPSEASIHNEAIHTNIAAATDAIRLLRIGLATNRDGQAAHDLKRANTHIAEVASLLQGQDPKVVKKTYKGDVATLATEVKALDSETSSNAAHADMIAKSGLDQNFAPLKTAVGL